MPGEGKRCRPTASVGVAAPRLRPGRGAEQPRLVNPSHRGSTLALVRAISRAGIGAKRLPGFPSERKLSAGPATLGPARA